MSATNQHSLRIPSAKRYLGDVRTFVEAYAHQAGFAEHEVEHIKLAADEACTNIIEHAYQNQDQNAIELVISIQEQTFSILLRHRGKPFDAMLYHRPQDLRASLNARKGGGWGVFLMNRLMDEVAYRSENGTNEVLLTKRRNTPSHE